MPPQPVSSTYMVQVATASNERKGTSLPHFSLSINDVNPVVKLNIGICTLQGIVHI